MSKHKMMAGIMSSFFFWDWIETWVVEKNVVTKSLCWREQHRQRKHFRKACDLSVLILSDCITTSSAWKLDKPLASNTVYFLLPFYVCISLGMSCETEYSSSQLSFLSTAKKKKKVLNKNEQATAGRTRAELLPQRCRSPNLRSRR